MAHSTDGPYLKVTFRLSQRLQRGLHALQARDGISVSLAIRRAIAEYLQAKGIEAHDLPTTDK